MTAAARPYQTEAIQSVIDDWNAGYSDVLITMATGLGKTFVFLSLLNKLIAGTSKRALILAHRQDLITQPMERLHAYYPEWKGKAGIVMADIDEPNRQIVIATVQTLGSAKRLGRILAHGPIDYLVTDESHHAVSASYKKVYETLKKANPALCHVGVTATPARADGDGLSGVYQKESFHFGIREGIRAGYLSPVRWLAIQTKISVAGVKTQAGDFQQRGLANVFEADNAFDLVVETHKRFAADRQAAAFVVSVEGAYRLAEKFNAAGIPAAAASADTDRATRAKILKDFADGRTQVLCNVALWTEGLDVPQISCIHQVRPTKSDGLYTQIIGRALRIYPGKEDALILDYCPAETRNIAMAGDVLGVPLKKEAYLQEDTEQGEPAGGFTFDGQFTYLEGNPAEIISRQLDYLDVSPWSWWRARDGWMSLGLGEASDHIERILLISPVDEETGEMTLYGIARKVEHIKPAAEFGEERKVTGIWKVRGLARGGWVVVSEQAENTCNRYGNGGLAMRAKAWRNQPPSDAQIAFAKRLKGAWQPGMNRGELAQSITHAQAMKEVDVYLKNTSSYAYTPLFPPVRPQEGPQRAL